MSGGGRHEGMRALATRAATVTAVGRAGYAARRCPSHGPAHFFNGPTDLLGNEAPYGRIMAS